MNIIGKTRSQPRVCETTSFRQAFLLSGPLSQAPDTKMNSSVDSAPKSSIVQKEVVANDRVASLRHYRLRHVDSLERILDPTLKSQSFPKSK
jgi:hypothetical protein